MTKVLVVEDDPLNTELVLEIVKALGFKADTAENGDEAIRKAKGESYDLILMDIGLPGMDGVQTLEIIRNNPGYKGVPVIALTSYAMKGDRDRFIEAGFDDYIPKPINVHEFMEKMKEYKT